MNGSKIKETATQKQKCYINGSENLSENLYVFYSSFYYFTTFIEIASSA